MRAGTQEVPIEPSVLKWARESIGRTIDEVATRLDLGRKTVEAWETGKKNPTLKQLRELAVYFKRPLAALFLPAAPQEPPFPTDFRSLPIGTKKPFSEKTLLALRRARRLQELSRDLATSLGQSPLPKIEKASLSDDPYVLATLTREQLGITIERQYSWSDEVSALSSWKSAVELRGVLVLELPFPIIEGRGFSLFDEISLAIVLNSNDVLNGRIFSLFHEYVHLLLRESGICDLSEEGKAIEQFCNQFAGELLVPKSAILQHPLVDGHGARTSWDDHDLEILARLFKVSREVILRRLLTLGRTSHDFYEQKRTQWEAELGERSRRHGRRVPARQCVRQNGLMFTSMVLEAAQQERITYRDVSDFLSIGLKHLAAVEALVRENATRRR